MDKDTPETILTWLTTLATSVGCWTTRRSAKAQEERILRHWATSSSRNWRANPRNSWLRPTLDHRQAPRPARAADCFTITSKAYKIQKYSKINYQEMNFKIASSRLCLVVLLKMRCSHHAPVKASKFSKLIRTRLRFWGTKPWKLIPRRPQRITTINSWMPKTRSSPGAKMQMDSILWKRV